MDPLAVRGRTSGGGGSEREGRKLYEMCELINRFFTKKIMHIFVGVGKRFSRKISGPSIFLSHLSPHLNGYVAV